MASRNVRDHHFIPDGAAEAGEPDPEPPPAPANAPGHPPAHAPVMTGNTPETPVAAAAATGSPAVDGWGAQADQLQALLQQVAGGQVSVTQALEALKLLPFEDMGFAHLDHHRHLRKGFAEVIYCSGKTDEQLTTIVARLAQRSGQLLGTRATPQQYEAARAVTPALKYHAAARAIYLDAQSPEQKLPGCVVVAAGTSDLPVAEEAALTLQVMGHAASRCYDVGVAGLHRLLHHLPALQQANVLVVVAGMEGALPSVVGGLVSCPVVATPTSVGYGSSFQGLAALLSMLNSCAPGIGVVNIDNGFGAGYLAATINQSIHAAARPKPS